MKICYWLLEQVWQHLRKPAYHQQLLWRLQLWLDNNHEQEAFMVPVLEGFLNKEARWRQILREDSFAVGGNGIDANKSRNLAAINRQMDLQALVRDYHTMMPNVFLDSIVKFFFQWLSELVQSFGSNKENARQVYPNENGSTECTVFSN